MDMRLLKPANSVVIGFRRIFGERIALSVFDDHAAARGVLERALASDDAELKAAAAEMAKGMGFSLTGKATQGAASAPAAHKAAPASTGVTESQWAAIESAAMKFAGPIAVILTGQLKDEGASNFEDAVEKMAEKIGGGSMGADFKKEARAAKR